MVRCEGRWIISIQREPASEIAGWIEATHGRDIPTGLGVDEALGLAVGLIERLEKWDGDKSVLEWSTDLPDVLHAFCRIVLQRSGGACDRTLETARKAYGVIDRFLWDTDYFDEKSEILALLAFVAWNECRKGGLHPQMGVFEGHCERHVMARPELRDFLALPFEQRSNALNVRFLSDPTVLLASVLRLGRLCNAAPDAAAREAPRLHTWISENDCGRPAEEIAWFSIQAALFAAGTFRHLGEFREAERWINVAKASLVEAGGLAALRAQIEYARLAILYDTGDYDVVLKAVPQLIQTFAEQSMERDAAKASYLEANSLKAVGNCFALRKFLELVEAPAIRQDPLLLGLCLLSVGELGAREGGYMSALRYIREARPLLESSGVWWGLAHLRSVMGEVLRDEGHLSAAIEAYRSAFETYEEGGFSCRAAYMRVILAETLIAAGRETEAIGELVAALPVIEKASLTREGVAAVALLRATLRRCRTDAQGLRTLREQLGV